MANEEKVIEIQKICPKTVTVHIVGDTDLVINKMNDVTARELTDIRNDKAKKLEKPNEWEKIITSIHWRDGKPKEFNEESFVDALTNNAPCITSFGLRKSFGEAVVRFGVDKYSTKIDACMNILAPNGLVPIKFAEHFLEEKLMSPQKGRPVLVKINRFSGWSADIKIKFLESVYTLEQIVNIINLAGFGIGISSGRRGNCNGRYHVESVI